MDIRDSCCVFSGCDCHKHLDAHPIQHRANNGDTSLWNLVKLCQHHHTLLQEGQYSVERLADGELLFKRPDGSVPQPESTRNGTDSGDKLDCPSDVPCNLPPASTEPWAWCGDSMDYDMALFAFASQTRDALKDEINNEFRGPTARHMT